MIKKQFKDNELAAIEERIRLLLHAGRDTMRNQGRYEDTKNFHFDVNNPYYAEAFGIFEGLELLGYIGCDRKWFDRCVNMVMEEEHFGGSNKCAYCFNRYGKDTANPHPTKKGVLHEEVPSVQ